MHRGSRSGRGGGRTAADTEEALQRGASVDGSRRAAADAEHALELVGSRRVAEHGEDVGAVTGRRAGTLGRDDPARPAAAADEAGDDPAASAHAGLEALAALDRDPRARRGARSGEAALAREERGGHREHALAATLVRLVPRLLETLGKGLLALLISHHHVGGGDAELRHRRRVRQVDNLRRGEHRAALLGEHAVQVGGPDKVGLEHDLRRLAVDRADEPAGAERG